MRDFLELFFIVVISCAIVVVPLGILIAIPVYYSACRQADVYNERNNTHYTCGDFFWAGDQINANTRTIKLR